MNWQDEGFILSKLKYNENSIIINVFTKNHGKRSAIVYGGNSSKQRNFLQVGNKIFVVYKSKNDSKIGYFSSELKEPITPFFFDDEKKITCILSALSILKIVLPENQVYKEIYDSLEKLLKNIKKNDWIFSYIFWEQYLIKRLGYEITFQDDIININGKNLEFPKFLKTKNVENVNNQEISLALNFNKNLLLDNFMDENINKIPLNRNLLEGYFH